MDREYLLYFDDKNVNLTFLGEKGVNLTLLARSGLFYYKEVISLSSEGGRDWQNCRKTKLLK